MSNWVTIGRLHRARGIHGELLAELDSSEPGREQRLRRVELVAGDQRRFTEVEEAWWHQAKLVLKFSGIDSMTDAEAWERAEIRVAPEDVVQPSDGAYSYADLIGCVVVAAEHDVTREIGVVDRIEEFGSAPVLAVVDAQGKEHLIPFVKAMLEEVNPAQKRIRMKLPEGLLEL